MAILGFFVNDTVCEQRYVKDEKKAASHSFSRFGSRVMYRDLPES